MPQSIQLTSLPTEKLRDVVFSRLHGEDAGGPALDGSDVFGWIADTYCEGDLDFKQRIDAILKSFLADITDDETWPGDAAENLLDLLQDIGERLSSVLFEMARSGILLQYAERGRHLQSGLLKCLISTGHTATPDFWWQQFEMLGPEYGAVIASGLSDHGLQPVMSGLPRLSEHETARQAIRFLWRHLVDQYRLEPVAQALRELQSQLPPETFEMYDSDLQRLRGQSSPVVTHRHHVPATQLEGTALKLVNDARKFNPESPLRPFALMPSP